MNKLAIHVRSGLCNRLRVVLSAIAYCELTNRELLIHWPYMDKSEPRGDFEATLTDLFDHPFREISESEFHSAGRLIRQTDITLSTPGDLRMRTINMFPGAESPLDTPQRNLHHFLAGRSHYQKSFADYFSVMKPSKAVTEKVLAWLPSIGVYGCVGVQIRAEYPNTEPPIDKFISRMRRFERDATFFLSTDKAEVAERIKLDFPGRILQLPQTYVYDRQTIITRCAELYLLASCRHILGSYISSFSEFAGWLAGSRYSACYLWPADAGDRYEDVGLWEESK